jgi:hypothetical protein
MYNEYGRRGTTTLGIAPNERLDYSFVDVVTHSGSNSIATPPILEGMRIIR